MICTGYFLLERRASNLSLSLVNRSARLYPANLLAHTIVNMSGLRSLDDGSKPTQTAMANNILTTWAKGTEPENLFNMCDFFGSMTFLHYKWAELQSLILQIQTPSPQPPTAPKPAPPTAPRTLDSMMRFHSLLPNTCGWSLTNRSAAILIASCAPSVNPS